MPRDKKKKGDKEASPEESANGELDNDDDDDEDEGAGDKVVWSTDTSTAAVEKRAAEQLSNAMAGMVTRGNVEAEQEAAARRAEKEAAAVAKVRWGQPVSWWPAQSGVCLHASGGQ